MESLRLLIADDHEIVRRGVRCLLEAQSGWRVTAEASNGREAVEKARQLKPDVAILDIGMPLMNGLEASRQMIRNDPNLKIVILTVHDSENLVREVLNVGGRGYVLKADAEENLVTAIHEVRSDRTFFTDKVEEILLRGYLDTERKLEGTLTPRQREIVQLLAEGQSSKQVAVALGLSVKTVETHRANIMRVLDCHSVSGVVRYAVRNNIIQA
jgi:DNA-binding NarL/FixJ family response regulator